MSVNVAIVGATGAVGQEFLTVLAERKFPIELAEAAGQRRSAGKKVEFRRQDVHRRGTDEGQLQGVQIAFFSAGGSISQEFAPAAVARGRGRDRQHQRLSDEGRHSAGGAGGEPRADSKAQRPDRQPQLLDDHHERAGLAAAQGQSREADHRQHLPGRQRRGAQGLHELEQQIKAYASGSADPKISFPHQIVNNLFSHNTKIAENGYNEEENKMVNETRKIFGDPKIMVTATCVRVPIPRAHCESINLEFERPMTPQQVREILAKAPGVTIVDDREKNHFPMPLEASGQDDVLVGRIRQDISREDGRGIELFVSGDQIRKGAATNAVQIGERLV